MRHKQRGGNRATDGTRTRRGTKQNLDRTRSTTIANHRDGMQANNHRVFGLESVAIEVEWGESLSCRARYDSNPLLVNESNDKTALRCLMPRVVPRGTAPVFRSEEHTSELQS